MHFPAMKDGNKRKGAEGRAGIVLKLLIKGLRRAEGGFQVLTFAHKPIWGSDPAPRRVQKWCNLDPLSGRYFRTCPKAPRCRCSITAASVHFGCAVLEVGRPTDALRRGSNPEKRVASALVSGRRFALSPGWAVQRGSSSRRRGLLTGLAQLGKSGSWRWWDGGRAAHFRVGPSEASDLDGRDEKEVIKRGRASA